MGQGKPRINSLIEFVSTNGSIVKYKRLTS